MKIDIDDDHSEYPTPISNKLLSKSLNSFNSLGITDSITSSCAIVALTKQLFYYLFDESIVSPRDILKINVIKIIPQLQYLYEKQIKSLNSL